MPPFILIFALYSFTSLSFLPPPPLHPSLFYTSLSLRFALPLFLPLPLALVPLASSLYINVAARSRMWKHGPSRAGLCTSGDTDADTRPCMYDLSELLFFCTRSRRLSFLVKCDMHMNVADALLDFISLNFNVAAAFHRWTLWHSPIIYRCTLSDYSTGWDDCRAIGDGCFITPPHGRPFAIHGGFIYLFPYYAMFLLCLKLVPT